MVRIVVAAGILAVLSSPAMAGELVLKNGDRVSGDLVELKEGKIVFKTAHGDLAVPVGEVASLSMKEAKMVLVGEGPAEPAALVTDGKGVFDWKGKKVALADVASILPPPAPLVRLSEPERWSGTVGASVTWTDGNTHTLSYHGDVNLVRDQSQAVEDFKNKLSITLAYDFGKSAGLVNKRQGKGAGKWEWFFHPRVGAYVEGSWLYDYFAGFERKNTLGAGLSAKVVDRENEKVNFDVGVSYVGTFYNDKTVAAAVAAGATPVTFEEYPAARVSLEVLLKKLPAGLDFHHKTTAFQSLEDQEKHTLESETSLSRELGGGWFFKLSALYAYVEPPAPGKLRWDATYILSLVFKF